MQTIISQALSTLIETLDLRTRRVDSDADIGSTTTSYVAPDNKLGMNITTFANESRAEEAIDALHNGLGILTQMESLSAVVSEHSDLCMLNQRWAQAIATAFPEVQRRFFAVMNVPTDRISGEYKCMVLMLEDGSLVATTFIDTEDDVSEELLEGLLNGSAMMGFFEKHADELMALV